MQARVINMSNGDVHSDLRCTDCLLHGHLDRIIPYLQPERENEVSEEKTQNGYFRHGLIWLSCGLSGSKPSSELSSYQANIFLGLAKIS